ncbi:MAG TPA: BTAD domain-containing putative transcriptional regulator [Jatrophihabitantaceae bacterium]|nr:BTAD domain-containing putative transcriptional regulator [Jatrophihabitantaceae bacterium]
MEAELSGAALDLGGPKQRSVLALLLSARGQVVPVDRIVDDIWRGEPPPSAMGVLQAYISNLRRILEPDRAPRKPAQLLVSAPPGYALRLADSAVDAWQFEELLDQATRTAHPANRVASLRAALGLWRGPAFAEFAAEPWAGPEATRLEQLRLSAREQLIDAVIHDGSPAEAAAEAETLVRDHPLREEGWRLLALAQYTAGRQGDALDALRRARATLADELGVDPGPRLRELENAVRSQTIDIGASKPPAALGGRVVLPVPATPLLGRDRELDELGAQLADDSTGLVIVTGPGGTGKTRLVIAAAERAAASFADGVWFVALYAATTSDLMWSAIGDVLNADRGHDDVAQPVLDRLADRNLLLVLDNLEQIADADEVVVRILSESPGITVLASSRRPLLLAAEQEFPLAPLVLPASDDLDDVVASGAGQLFAHYATLARPSFRITSETAATVATLCRRLDGLPLALELAAAHTRVLSPRALLAHLHRLGVGVTARDRPDRQRTLAATIAWSYDLLDADAQRVFRRLGVFRGPVDLDGVGVVVPADARERESLFEAVTNLANASLIRIDESAAHEPRLGMLETIRWFALDRLEASNDYSSVRMRHVEWCRDTVARLTPLLRSRHRTAALRQLQALEGDIREALEFALAAPGPTNAVGRDLVADLGTRHWYLHRDTADSRAWQERALEIAPYERGPQSVDLLHGMARAALRDGDIEVSRGYFDQAIAMAREIGDKGLESRELHGMSNVHRLSGDLPGALRFLQESLSIARDAGDTRAAANALGNIVGITFELGDPDEAMRVAAESMALNVANGDEWDVAIDRLNLFTVMRQAEGLDEAWSSYREWAPDILSMQDEDLDIYLLEHGVALLGELGRHADAVAVFATAETARARSLRVRPPSVEADVLPQVEHARAALSQQEWDDAFSVGRDLSARQAIELALTGALDVSLPE